MLKSLEIQGRIRSLKIKRYLTLFTQYTFSVSIIYHTVISVDQQWHISQEKIVIYKMLALIISKTYNKTDLRKGDNIWIFNSNN